ncbi:hypothetical protein FA13DRAFT_1797199 [Coprinellus micaceus]|uniref:Uncharacterized protein n=1 Tax=Coprinellus micaceus TaxID=71717 RepID=A0A4Y7SRQ6_COPMI|nr:hypothetical protein FA13DRAFT_1797199 [Coprinellus micaceus]
MANLEDLLFWLEIFARNTHALPDHHPDTLRNKATSITHLMDRGGGVSAGATSPEAFMESYLQRFSVSSSCTHHRSTRPATTLLSANQDLKGKVHSFVEGVYEYQEVVSVCCAESSAPTSVCDCLEHDLRGSVQAPGRVQECSWCLSVTYYSLEYQRWDWEVLHNRECETDRIRRIDLCLNGIRDFHRVKAFEFQILESLLQDAYMSYHTWMIASVATASKDARTSPI